MKRKKELSYSEEIIVGLQSGLDSVFRRAEKFVIEENIKDLANDILNNDEITEKQREDLRKWYNFLQWFINLPEEIIESVKVKPDAQLTEYDPFDKIKKEIINA